MESRSFFLFFRFSDVVITNQRHDLIEDLWKNPTTWFVLLVSVFSIPEPPVRKTTQQPTPTQLSSVSEEIAEVYQPDLVMDVKLFQFSK